jgi:hypothetical protein
MKASMKQITNDKQNVAEQASNSCWTRTQVEQIAIEH